MSNAIVHAIAVAELRSIVEGVESIESDIRDLNADKAHHVSRAQFSQYRSHFTSRRLSASSHVRSPST